VSIETTSPEGGRAAPARRPRLSDYVEYVLLRVWIAKMSLLPERVGDRLGRLLGRFAHSVLRIRRRDVDVHLERAFPGRSAAWRRRVSRESYEHFGAEVVATFRLARLGPEDVRERTEMVGLDPIRRAVESGRGAVIVTGHLGAWEIGGAALAAWGLPTDVVVQRQSNPLFDAYLDRTRGQLGVRALLANDAATLVPRSLSEGHVVPIVADHNLRRGGIFVDFFGVPASTAKGPALFAMRARAPIFMAASIRLPGWPPRYEVGFEEIEVPETGTRGERVRALTERHVAMLEEQIRRYPEQYFWMHRRWKTRPEASAPRSGGGQEPVFE
jgi:Kdo2-lipid IVA lauroyltransferase/acyltransferase